MPKTTIMVKSNLKEGTYESPSYQLPPNLIGNFEVHLLMDKVDIENPAFSVTLDTFISNNNIEWRYYAGIRYVGGVYNPPGIPGFGVYNAERIAGKYVKAKIVTNHRMNIGVEVESF